MANSSPFEVLPLSEDRTEAFHAVVDSVAREGRYLAMLQAFPLDEVRKYVAECLAKERPHFLAVCDDEVVGWCDISEKPRDTLKHSGILGMGIVRPYRERGIGAALMERT